ncbi:hypothetical protein [Streptomyces sp. SPB074]|nr:hypothetical protein [Streptomyces sp. SPB074]
MLSIVVEKESGDVVCSAEQARLHLVRDDAALPRRPELAASRRTSGA